MLNPYEVNSSNALNSSQGLARVPNQIAQSRDGIAVVALLFGLCAILLAFTFFWNLYALIRGIDSNVEVTPLWLIASVLRSVGLAYLSFVLWQYQLAIKNWFAEDELSCLRFAKMHVHLWRAGAIYLAIALAYGILNAIFIFYENA